MDDDDGKVIADLSFTIECKMAYQDGVLHVRISAPIIHTKEMLRPLEEAPETLQFSVHRPVQIQPSDAEDLAVRYEANLLLPPTGLVHLVDTVFVKTLVEFIREKYGTEFSNLIDWVHREEKQRNVRHFGTPHRGPSRNFGAFLGGLRMKRQGYYQSTGRIPTALPHVAAAIEESEKTLESRIRRSGRKWKDDVEKETRPRRIRGNEQGSGQAVK